MKGLVCFGVVALLAVPVAVQAQTGVSVGVGGGVAGTTDQSLSDGRTAPIVMAAATISVVPLFAIGAEVDYWRRRVSNAGFGTAFAQIHVPATPLSVKLGAGYGTGDPIGVGKTSGPAGQVGLDYDFTLPGAPMGISLFANAFLAHASAHSIQMVDGGIALNWR